MRTYDHLWFGGNGIYSGLEVNYLVNRLHEGFILLGGMEQGPWPTECETELEDIIRDIAAALTGKNIEFTDKLPYPGKLNPLVRTGFFIKEAVGEGIYQ